MPLTPTHCYIYCSVDGVQVQLKAQQAQLVDAPARAAVAMPASEDTWTLWHVPDTSRILWNLLEVS